MEALEIEPELLQPEFKQLRTTVKDNKRIYCDVYAMVSTTNSALTKHLLTDAHKDGVAGIEKPAPAKSVVALAAVRALAKSRTGHITVRPATKTSIPTAA